MANIAKQLDPYYADPYNAIATSLNEIDQYDEAMENVLRAIDINRSKPNYPYTLGNIFLNKGKLYLAPILAYSLSILLTPIPLYYYTD